MNEFDEIRKKMDNYSLDSYNVSQGWNKLQKREGGKKHLLVKMSVGVAAACVMTITGYWFLREKENINRVQDVATLSTPLQKNPGVVITNSLPKSIDKLIEMPQPSALKKTLHHLTNNKKRYSAIVQPPQNIKEEYAKLNRRNVFIENDVNIDNPAVPIAQRESMKRKPLDIVSEEQLLAMISVHGEPEPKQSKLKRFFISRGEQQEYTVDRYSSDPLNVSPLNF